MNNGHNKSTILIFGEPKYFNEFIQQKDIPIYPLFKDISLIQRIIRKLFFSLKLPKTLWFAEWKYKLLSVKTVVFFSNSYIDALKYIKSVNPEIRIIFWYWNPVFKSISPHKVPDHLCEKWSFDRNDCKNYNLKYNTQFYPGNIKLPQNEIIYDAVFLGQDKGRRSMINSIKDQLLAANVKPYIYIVDDSATHRNYKGTSPVVPYEDYLILVSKSIAILDFVQEGQDGLTLRPLEAIFFQKKLITNDKFIRAYGFYHPNNIFIVGIDKMEYLKRFLTAPFEPVSNAVLNHYDVSNWLKRFIE